MAHHQASLIASIRAWWQGLLLPTVTEPESAQGLDGDPADADGASTSRLSRTQQEAIVSALRDRGATSPCSRCDGNAFELQPELALITLHGTAGAGCALPSTRDLIPAALVICTGCGAINQHALGALGLIGYSVFPA